MPRTRYVAQAGVIAAVYAALTLAMVQTPLGYGPVQLRLSEALTVVACLTPAAIPGLWAGTLIANAWMLAQVGVGIGQALVVYGLGLPLLGALRRLGLAARLGPDGEEGGSRYE